MDVIKAMGRNKDEFIRMVGCDPCYDSLLEPSSEVTDMYILLWIHLDI